MINNKIGQYLQSGRAWYNRDVKGITKITVHHTASPAVDDDGTAMTRAYRTHVNNGWPGLSYHFFIPKSGNIYQINEYKWVTWHDGSNWDSIGVVLDGYFHPDKNEHPTIEQLRSLRWLLDHLCTQHPEFPADQNDVYGHRERMATACPGDNFYPMVTEYRNNNGNITWGSPETSPPTDPCKDIRAELEQTKQDLNEKNTKISQLNTELTEKTELCTKQNEQLQQFGNLQDTLTEVRDKNRELTEKLEEFSNNAEGLITQETHNEEIRKLENKLKTQYNRDIDKEVDKQINNYSVKGLLVLIFRKVIKYE